MTIVSFFLSYLHVISELAACIAAAYFHNYLRKSFMKWFLPFFSLLFVGELTAKMWIYSFEIYYIIGVAEVVFYGFIFYNLFEEKRSRYLTVLLMLIAGFAYLVTYLVLDTKPYQTFYAGNVLFFGFAITIIALIYLNQLLKTEDRVIGKPGFWIAFGVIVFFSGISIVLSLYSFIVANDLRLFDIKLYNIIPRLLCPILYGSFIVSMILYKREMKNLKTAGNTIA
jgi:hypothetical protein